MKTIESLLELANNPHYQFSPEEQERLNAFLAKRSEPQRPQKHSTSTSGNGSPATVHKNVVKKEDNVLPTDEQVKTSKELAEQKPYTHTEAA